MSQTKGHNKKFLKTFFQDRKHVGAVAPSSRFLVNKMCSQIDFKNAKVILELGPGTGVFTRELLDRMTKDCKLFVFELNNEFYNMLKSEFDDPRIVLLNRSADEINLVLEEYNIKKVDAVLSSLPLAVLPDRIKKKIVISSWFALNEGGKYLQYQYSLNAKKLLQMKFGRLKIHFVPVNVPPAFVYVGTKKSS